MKIFSSALVMMLCMSWCVKAQVNYNANTYTNVYNDYFLYGSNMGSPQGWSDEQVAEILIGNPSKGIVGAGVNSLRPAMYDRFVERWGFGIRSDAFKFYQQLGARNNTIFLNEPSTDHLDNTQYCSGKTSKIFANLYEPIWANGMINEKNYYARYVYNVAKTYGPYVKFWEVWNEPDYTSNWSATQKWNSSNPNPCDLNKWLAPIQHYVRMLRITYEVVKSIDPDAFICLGGIGYATFLEAVLRNTDNPVDGSVAGEYTQKGGAWFDCVSFHIYPMYYLGSTRNSDVAANSIITRKKEYEDVLTRYAYNGTTYPKKEYIITECNVPSKSLQGYIGSDEAQRNFLIKAAVASQKSNIHGLYVYGLGDEKTYNEATGPYQMMGFYKVITGQPYNVTPNSCATSWRTTSTLLKDRRYDKAETDALKLPANVDGAAFYSEKEKNYIYVLWAKLTGDNHETGSASYSFPATMEVKAMTQHSWDQKESTVAGSSINLTGSPVFVRTSGTIVSVTNVSLNKTATTLTINQTETLTATITPANATNKNVTWSSNNANIATVSVSGLITAKAAGTAAIIVTTSDGAKTATCNVTVTAPANIAVTGVSLNKTTMSLTVNQTETLTATITPANATNKNATWTSSNANVATVSASGLVTAKAAGTATITIKTTDGSKTATCNVTVTTSTVSVIGVSLNKTAMSLTMNQTETLTATIAPANATNKNVTWSSSNANVATVSTSGLVTAKAAGTATITVKTTDGSKTATCNVTVTVPVNIAVTGVSLNKTTATLTVNQTEALAVTVAPTNASNKNVTWSSSNTSIVAVSTSGVITAKAAGTAVITVRTADGNKTATCNVTVTAVTSVDDSEIQKVTVYPNPNDGRFILNFEKQGTYQVSIVNMVGITVLRKTVSDIKQEIDISTQPAGIYLVVLDDGKRRTTVKIVKQ